MLSIGKRTMNVGVIGMQNVEKNVESIPETVEQRIEKSTMNMPESVMLRT
jgi:hypothetical protein